jgi:hypothetical protein
VAQPNPPFEGVLAQFVNAKNNASAPNIKVDFFTFNSTTTPGTWEIGKFPVATPNDIAFAPGKLPEAVRITMDLQDKQKRAIRTISRAFWIANGNNSD